MKIRKLHPLFLLFLALVAIGLFQLLLRPLELLSTVFLYAAVILIFVAIYRYMIKKKQSNSNEKVKFSSQKLFASQKRESSTPIKKDKLKQKKKRTTNHPFTVIEGNKGKKKKPHSS